MQSEKESSEGAPQYREEYSPHSPPYSPPSTLQEEYSPHSPPYQPPSPSQSTEEYMPHARSYSSNPCESDCTEDSFDEAPPVQRPPVPRAPPGSSPGFSVWWDSVPPNEIYVFYQGQCVCFTPYEPPSPLQSTEEFDEAPPVQRPPVQRAPPGPSPGFSVWWDAVPPNEIYVFFQGQCVCFTPRQ